MSSIKVKHKIGDIVQHSFNDEKFKVIGYTYIDGDWVQYICMWNSAWDLYNFRDIELVSSNETTINFKI